jgi:hypothetical protein
MVQVIKHLNSILHITHTKKTYKCGFIYGVHFSVALIGQGQPASGRISDDIKDNGDFGIATMVQKRNSVNVCTMELSGNVLTTTSWIGSRS